MAMIVGSQYMMKSVLIRVTAHTLERPTPTLANGASAIHVGGRVDVCNPHGEPAAFGPAIICYGPSH